MSGARSTQLESALDRLIARPIAHRGLHDASAGIIENTASAFSAAIAAGYGIECDVQVSADGEAMVYHDDALGRLTEGSARLDTLSAAEIGKVRFKQSADRILTLSELCALVAGRVALLIELKSHFDGDARLAQRVAAVLADYSGPAAAMSFDPEMVAQLRQAAPTLPRGLTAQARPRRRAGALRKRHYALPACHAGAAAVHRLPCTGFAGARAARAAPAVRPAALGLDRAQRGGPHPRRHLCRPGRFRGLAAVTIAGPGSTSTDFRYKLRLEQTR